MVDGAGGLSSSWQAHFSSLRQHASCVRARIDAYDQMAQKPLQNSPGISLPQTLSQDTFTGRTVMSDETLVQQWKDCSSHRLVRDFCSEFLDSHFKTPERLNPFAKGIVEKVKPLANGASDYRKLFNWNDYKIDVGKGEEFRTSLHCLATSDGRKTLANYAKYNFIDSTLPNMRPSEYFKRVVVGGNVESIIDPIEKGRFFTGLFKAGWLGLGALPVFERTKEAYTQTKSIAHSASVFVRESAKSLTAWEVATIGSFIGELMFPAGRLALVGAGVMMGLFSAISHKVLDQIFPP